SNCGKYTRRVRASGHGIDSLFQIAKESRVDVLLSVVRRLDDSVCGVALQGLRKGNVAPHIGYVAKDEAAHDLRRAPEHLLFVRFRQVDYRLEVLELLGVRVDEAAVRDGGVEAIVLILVGILNLREMLRGEHGTAHVRRIAAEPT